MHKQHLLDELARYQDRDEECERLTNLVEDSHDLELTDNQHEGIVDSLDELRLSIGKRIHDLNDQIESHNNQALDNFIRRQIR